MASVLERWREAEQHPADVSIQRELLTSIFEEFGKSHPQRITPQELLLCLEQLEVPADLETVEHVARVYDEDEDGLLEFDEWLQSILAIKVVCIPLVCIVYKHL